MSNDDAQKDGRARLIIALVAFLVVAAGVLGGGYLVYRQFTKTGPAPGVEDGNLPAPTAALPQGDIEPISSPTLASWLVPTITPSVRPTTAGATPLLTLTLAPSGEPTAAEGVAYYAVDYVGCESPGGNALKGQVFDRHGNVVQGAQVFITIDGWPYEEPATSNQDGWYEFYLVEGQKVSLSRLLIGGVEQILIGDADQQIPVRPDCFQHVDLRED